MVNSGTEPAAPPQVLIAGAGPVGLTAAHELARRGLRVRLIDAAPGPARTSRAVATHPRTLETYDQMGVVDAMLARGRRNAAFTMYAEGRRLVRLQADYASMPTAYPFTLVIGQTDTEAVLREAVARLGVDIEWGVRLTGFDQRPDGVRVTLEDTDGARSTVDTSWLVGCDGGHSTVRKLLGLELAGTSSETWMLADVPVTMDLPPDTIYWAHTGGQALMMVPYAREGHWRLLDTVPDRDAEGVEERLGAKLSKGLGRPVTVGPSEWTSVFTFQQRRVDRMREGRVFVAGDAAHVHSPASGQGMNTGIQEAYNLAWKLAQVEQGHAADRLLDSYGAERVPVGAALLDSTRTATVLVQLKNLLAAAVLPVVFTVVRNVTPLRRAIQRKVLGGMSGLRIGYGASPLTTPGTAATGPAPGGRARGVALDGLEPTVREAFAGELRDVRWSLLLGAGGTGPGDVPVGVAVTAAAQYAEWLSVRTLGGRADGSEGPAPLGPVRRNFAGPRRLARTLAARPHHPSTSSTRVIRAHAESTHQTPRADPRRSAGQALADPGGALRTALGLRPGSWLLVRPDGYVAARGPVLSRTALDRALAPVGPSAPLALPARVEPRAVSVHPAPTKEHRS